MDLYARHLFPCQMTHPWHSLTYGNNAEGVAAATAVVGPSAYGAYVVYTKKMMEAALTSTEYTRRLMEAALATKDAEFRPHLIFDWVAGERLNGFDIHNVGRGPALALCVKVLWDDAAQSAFRSIQEDVAGRALGDLLPEAVISDAVAEELITSRRKQLMVFECMDIVNKFYQLQVLREMDEGGLVA
jgi:hypothetical protein